MFNLGDRVIITYMYDHILSDCGMYYISLKGFFNKDSHVIISDIGIESYKISNVNNDVLGWIREEQLELDTNYYRDVKLNMILC